MAETGHKAWQGKTDGTPWMQRSLIALFRVFPLWLLYGLMGLVIPFYMMFAPGFGASYRFFRKRIGKGPVSSFLHVYKNEFELGMVVLDRFAAYGGKNFKVEVEGRDIFEGLCAKESGFIMLTAHVGNFEMVGYTLSSGKTVNALVFGGETDTIKSNRSKVFGRTNVKVLPISGDMSHIFLMNDALSRGEIVSISGDRSTDSGRTISCPFMGENARFPLGPFKLAAVREIPVIAAYSLKTGMSRYKVYVEALPEYTGKENKIQFLADSYAASLEKIARKYPDQWYNFYDFWK